MMEVIGPIILVVIFCLFALPVWFETRELNESCKQLKVKHEELMLDNSLRVQKRRRRSQEKLAWEVAYRKALEETYEDYVGMLNYLSPSELRHYWENE